MKKYFAKLLPVFGKIEDGDFYISDRGHIFTNRKGTRPYKGDKKLLLFLVSKDIQKGDWVYHSEGNYGAVQSKKDTLYNVRFEKSFNSTAHIEDLVGVYGLVSPNAKWVKGGDEIDESSLGNPIDKLIVNPFAKMPINTFCDIYPIKCPCCDTFK